MPRAVQREDGFGLIELLVVILVIGILAAIALPAFAGSQAKGQDSDAKASVRNVASSVEACFGQTHAYSTCDTTAELRAAGAEAGTQLTDTTAQLKGAVSIAAATDTYTIVGYSKSDSTFSLAKAADGSFTRSCTADADGGCKTGNVW